METFMDLTGKTFDKLFVIEQVGVQKYPSGQSRRIWKCRCECGNEKEIVGSNLRSGQTTSCGCVQKQKASQARLIDLSGKKFGKLTVIFKSHSSEFGQPYWLCKCECGSEKTIAGNSLTSGKSKSCGCRQGRFTHGMWGKPGYKKVYLSDPIKKLKHIVGVSVRDALKERKSSKNGGRTFNYLPYSVEELKNHLESQFEPWMNWSNYGGKNDSIDKSWHIDHIVPQSSFSFKSLKDQQFQECWALTNLRPLEKMDNIRKGSTLIR